MPVVGWRLAAEDRAILLNRFPPAWPDVIADHVTLEMTFHVSPKLPPQVSAAIVGWVDDGAGLQALVVEVNGRILRPDGSVYHITWSLDRRKGREAAQSNAVLAHCGWQAMAEPIFITLIPARWP